MHALNVLTGAVLWEGSDNQSCGATTLANAVVVLRLYRIERNQFTGH
jgi:hypothetical protein